MWVALDHCVLMDVSIRISPCKNLITVHLYILLKDPNSVEVFSGERDKEEVVLEASGFQIFIFRYVIQIKYAY